MSPKAGMGHCLQNRPFLTSVHNIIAAIQVATKLLHKDLDNDQIEAMLEFARTMSEREGEASSPEARLIDADAFCRLVARFGNTK